MVILPAVGLGILAVFIIGWLITCALVAIIETIHNRRSPRDVGDWEEDDQGAISLVGGGIAVVLVVVLWCVHPEWSSIIWIVLTALGFLVAFLAFILRLVLANDQPSLTKVPPSQKGSYHSSANTKAPPSQNKSSQSSANTNGPPVYEQPKRSPRPNTLSHTQEDPYRALLAKARYDQTLADRLIEEERKRLPNANLNTICRSINERLERDNR